MKFLPSETIKTEEIKNNKIYVVGDIKLGFLGFLEDNVFYVWDYKKNKKAKTPVEQISLLKETEFNKEQIDLAMLTYTLDWYKNLKETILKERVVYSGIFLTESSSLLLKEEVEKVLPFCLNEWDIRCHHMTITLGEDEKYIDLLNKEQKLKVVSLGYSLELGVVAVKIETEVEVKGVFPHVTIAIDSDVKGKAEYSNKLKDFINFEKCFYINGYYNQIKNNKEFKY